MPAPTPFGGSSLLGQQLPDPRLSDVANGPLANQILDLVWPVASVRWTAGSTAATGFLLADGAAVSRTVYSRLFAKIGTTYGTGDGSTTFNVPNLKGKVAVGIDAADTAFDVLGETGGSKTSTAPHTHDLASHTHSLAGHDHSLSSHTHSLATHNHATTIDGNNFNSAGVTVNHVHGPGTNQFARTSTATGNRLSSTGNAQGLEFFDTTAAESADHGHNVNHGHTGSTSATPSNVGAAAGPSTNTSGGTQNVGAAAGPSTNTSGAGSAAATNGNLQPYIVLTPTIRY